LKNVQPRFAIAGLAALVFLAAVLPGLRGLNYPFLFDDNWAVVNNPLVVDSLDVKEIFSSNAWGSTANYSHTPNYRPLSVLSLAATHKMVGLNPLLYRLTNLMLHGAASVALMLLALSLGAGITASALGDLWFASHPIHAEAIFFVVTREELTSTLLILALLILAVKAFQSSSPEIGTRQQDKKQRALLLILTGTVTILALLFKEGAVTIPFLLIAVGAALPGSSWKTIAAMAGTAFVMLITYLGLRYWAIGSNPLVLVGPFERIKSALNLVPLALSLLVFPMKTTVDYGFNATGLPQTASLGLALVGFVIIISGLALYFWSAFSKHKSALIAVGVAVLAIPYALISNLIIPSSVLFGERLLYLPSAGFALILVGIAEFLRTKVSSRFIGFGAAAVVVLFCLGFMGMLASRNSDFKNAKSLFDSSLAAYPGSTRLWNNLGLALQQDGDLEAGLTAIERSLSIDPTNASALNNRGRVLMQLGRPQEAMDSLVKAIEMRPGMPAALGNLCILLASQPDVVRATNICQLAVEKGAPVDEVLEMLKHKATQGP
jgi:tetratricopeptide (TPR) repeat protein